MILKYAPKPLALASAFLFLLGACTSLPTETAESPSPGATAEKPVRAHPQCPGKPLRKVLVAAFPLRYPEQIRHGEYMGWAQTTAESLAQTLAREGNLLVSAAAQRFPYANIETGPELDINHQGKPLLTEWAAQARAQYVIAGIIGDFGKTGKWFVVPERQLAIEALIHDGTSGALLARKEFARQRLLINSLPKSIAPGTSEFANTRLGAAYNDLLAEIAAWAEDVVTCLPLPARVVRVEGRRLFIDIGADSGLRPGMGLAVSPPDDKGVPRIDAIVREVQAGHAVADLGFHRAPQSVKPGDVFHVADNAVRNKP